MNSIIEAQIELKEQQSKLTNEEKYFIWLCGHILNTPKMAILEDRVRKLPPPPFPLRSTVKILDM